MTASSAPLLEVQGLKKHFPLRGGAFRRDAGSVRAVDGVSFDVRRGEVFGLVGESGCGKTTTGRLVVRALEPTAGRILVHDAEGAAPLDLAAASRKQLRQQRRRIQMIFQDPFASLNPRMTVQQIVAEPLACYGIGNAARRRDRVAELLHIVGLDSGHMVRYPHSFSGGQRQRIGIARALALEPELVIADEAVSALDVSVQAQVLNLLQDLRDQLGLAYLFIAHDLSVVEHLCDRVAVMYLGKIVELAATEPLFRTPEHPYVEALLASVPRPDPSYALGSVAPVGEVGDLRQLPSGCAFHPRCPYATEVCRREVPLLRDVAPNGAARHLVACHRAEELSLWGIETPPDPVRQARGSAPEVHPYAEPSAERNEA